MQKLCGLLISGMLLVLSACSFENTVFPKHSVAPAVSQSYVIDTDEESGRYDIFTYETAELEDQFDWGGRLEYFFTDNLAVSASQTMGKHDFLSTDDDKLGEVDLAYRSLEVKGYAGWNMQDPSGGGYLSLGVGHADFDASPTSVDDLHIEDTVGVTSSFGVLQFLDPSKRVFVDLGARANLMRSEVEIEDNGNREEADLDLIGVFVPIATIGVRF